MRTCRPHCFGPFVLALALVAPAGAETILLRQGWWLAPSGALPGGESLSSRASGLDAHRWQPVTLPSTVLSALVAAGVYPDPYFGLNLRSVPGTAYPIGTNFSNLPMPPDSPFRASWWYVTRFSLPADFHGKTVWLGFDGINFRANVWFNGKPVATSDQMAGAWRLYRFNVTDAALPGADNALAVEIFPPQPLDLEFVAAARAPLRQARLARRLRPQGADDGLREPPRHVRSLYPQ